MSFIDGIDEQYLSANIECLCEEYEALWVVDVHSLEMKLLKVNPELAILGSVDTASKMNYDEAREWYIDQYVVDENKDHVRNETRMERVIQSIGEYNTYTINYKRINNNSINYNQLVYIRVNSEENLDHFLFGFRDIDRRKTAEIDDLTGLYNRQAFLVHARNMIDSNPDHEFDFVMSDFVDFKRINEQYGSRVGDRILTDYGKLLSLYNSEKLSICGRFAGDQFVGLVEHKSLEKRMLNLESPEKRILKKYPDVCVKLGIYSRVDRTLPVSIMFDRAHLALETIKHSFGTEMATYNNEIKEKVKQQRIIENSMSEALNNKQFKVYFQPKHDAVSGKIVGAEALVRWEHPEYGFMSPADFIPVFEKNGFVSEVDKYVLDTTCTNIRRWIDMGLSVVPVSINASRCDFFTANIKDAINEIVEAKHIPRDLIHIEITESMMEDNTQLLIETVTAIRNEGYQIELDDFGTGYSSINALSEFPIDVVKLDMSFMKQLTDKKRTRILSSCINLAKSLGYKTISEGVETQNQRELLKEYGVDMIQGYFYSKPLPEAEFENYLQENNNR